MLAMIGSQHALGAKRRVRIMRGLELAPMVEPRARLDLMTSRALLVRLALVAAVMFCHMGNASGQSQVLDPVVQFVSILVMDQFVVVERSPQVMGHNRSVFSNTLSVLRNDPVAVWPNATRARGSAMNDERISVSTPAIPMRATPAPRVYGTITAGYTARVRADLLASHEPQSTLALGVVK